MAEVTGFEGALAEFAALRQEIDNRSKYQWQLLTLQFTFIGAVFSFAISRSGLVWLLLIIPYGSYILCGRYLAQYADIDRIGRYIGEELSPQVPGGLHWEEWAAHDRRREPFLRGLTTPHFLAFFGASILALSWVFPSVFVQRSGSTPTRTGWIVTWSLGAVLTTISGYLVYKAMQEEMKSEERNRQPRASATDPPAEPLTHQAAVVEGVPEAPSDP